MNTLLIHPAVIVALFAIALLPIASRSGAALLAVFALTNLALVLAAYMP